MEIRASYLLVGSFVLTLVAGAFAFAIWLAKVQFDREFAHYDIFFAGNVNGLRVGTLVTFRGLPVGEVTDVAIDRERVELVRATIEISADTPVRSDSVATLVMTGLAGGVNVLLSGGSTEAAPLTAVAGRRPEIPSQSSALDQFIEGAPELVASLTVLVNRASRFLTPENQAAFSAMVQNLSFLSGVLADSSTDMQLLLSDSAGTMANVRDAAAAVSELTNNLARNSDDLIVRTNRALDSVADAASGVAVIAEDNREAIGNSIEAVGGMADEIEGLVAENKEAVTEFSHSALLEFAGLIIDARELVERLRRLSTEVERDPARFLFGDQQQGYEAGE